MKKEFLLNIIILISINLLIKPLYIFGIDAEVQNLSSPQNWEIYISFLNLCYIFQIINDVGIHSFNLQFISKNRELTSYYVAHILGLKGVLVLFYFIGLSLSFYILSYPWELFYFFLFIGVNQVINSALLYLRSNVSGNGLYLWDSVLSVLDKVLMILLMGYLLYYSGPSYEFKILHFVFAQGASLLITAFVAFIILSPLLKSISIRFSIDFIKKLIPQTLPFAIIFLLMTAYSRIDMIMLERMSTDNGHQIDAYSACYRLMDATNMFAYLFASLLLPMVAHLIHQREDIKPLVSIGLRTILVFSLVISFAMIFYRGPILSLLYDRADILFSEVLIYLMCSFICIAVAYVFGSSVVATGNVRSLNILFAFCLFLNILLNYILIPRNGAVGAAIATLITQGISTIGQIYLANNILKLRWTMREIGTIIAFGITVAMIISFSSTLMSIPWYFSLMIGIITCIIAALWMKMILIEEFLSLIKSKIKPR